VSGSFLDSLKMAILSIPKIGGAPAKVDRNLSQIVAPVTGQLQSQWSFQTWEGD
jgi:hypothetical protein